MRKWSSKNMATLKLRRTCFVKKEDTSVPRRLVKRKSGQRKWDKTGSVRKSWTLNKLKEGTRRLGENDM